MATVMPIGGRQHSPVGTWIAVEELELLKQLAKYHKVTVAAYVRAIIVDALQEEQTTIDTIHISTS